MIRFIVVGEPRGKGRPRFTRCGRPYTDKKTQAYEAMIQNVYRQCFGTMHEGPVSVMIHANHSVPKSWSKAARAMALSGEVAATRKPDADNIAKIVLDALNGLAWHDDTQVVELTVTKSYAENAYVDVVINKAGGGGAL